MENVVLIIHLIVAVAIIGLVLIQRSEGGGLGIGGGSGGMGGFATPRGTASALSRMTAFFAACFFITSLTLAIMAGAHHRAGGILENYEEVATEAVLEDDLNTDAESDIVKPSSEDVDTKPSVPTGE